jgi:hypothetical protein
VGGNSGSSSSGAGKKKRGPFAAIKKALDKAKAAREERRASRGS